MRRGTWIKQCKIHVACLGFESKNIWIWTSVIVTAHMCSWQFPGIILDVMCNDDPQIFYVCFKHSKNVFCSCSVSWIRRYLIFNLQFSWRFRQHNPQLACYQTYLTVSLLIWAPYIWYQNVRHCVAEELTEGLISRAVLLGFALDVSIYT